MKFDLLMVKDNAMFPKPAPFVCDTYILMILHDTPSLLLKVKLLLNVPKRDEVSLIVSFPVRTVAPFKPQAEPSVDVICNLVNFTYPISAGK